MRRRSQDPPVGFDEPVQDGHHGLGVSLPIPNEKEELEEPHVPGGYRKGALEILSGDRGIPFFQLQDPHVAKRGH